MLLSGIRTGKKKEKPRDDAQAQDAEKKEASQPVKPPSNTIGNNHAMADQLRQSLAAGKALPIASATSGFERRIDSRPVAASASPGDVIIKLPPGSFAASKKEEDWTVRELAAHERSQNMSLAEQEARNVMRMNKKRKIKERTLQNEDSDDEIERHLQHAQVDTTSDMAMKRSTHRQIAIHDKQERIMSKCWWWLESPSFDRRRLVAIGNFVSLVLAPPNLSLFPGEQFYLVPLQHAESLVSCDENVWTEIRRFQSSLNALFQQQGKGVLYLETVLPTSSFWQTKLEVVPVPQRQWSEASLYFKSSLSEMAQEHGTHQKLMHTSATKPLTRTIPAKNFSYFYMEYDVNAGFVQLIEETNFPKDFGLDTVAGMLGMDPVRFRRKQSSSDEEEKQYVSRFTQLWKEHDWTRELDG